MGEAGHAPTAVFAARLDRAMRTRVDGETGRAWTNRSLSEALGRRGHAASHAKIGRLRRAESQPDFADIEALAAALGVPVRYFFPDPDDDDDGERRVLAAMASSPHVRAVAMRLAEQGPISAQAAEAIISIMEQVQRLDNDRAGG
jgi:transcriptional regulator with XRE-family HTH domain